MMSRSMSAATSASTGPDDVFHAMPAILPPPPLSLHGSTHHPMSQSVQPQHSTQASFSNQVYMDSKEASDLSQLNGQGQVC